MKYLFLTLLILSPAVVSAQNYLVGIPGIGDPSGDFDGYLQAIYVMFISIAALLAVVKIVIAGVKYMLTDIAPQKTSAKQDIQGALVGLLVVLSAVLILTVINPDLTNFDFNANRVATPEAIPERNTNNMIAGTDQIRESGDQVLWIGTGRRISSREECEETYGVVIPGSGNVGDRCIISERIRENALPIIAEENCPDDRECRAELCNASEIGWFESCISQCTNRNGIIYDELANACVFYNDSYNTSTPINQNQDTVYYLSQNADQEAAGETRIEIEIISNTVENGFIEVSTPDGNMTISCGAVVPSLCN